MVNTARPARLGLVAAWLAAAPCAAGAASYECRIGQSELWRTVAQDLAARFPATVAECRVVEPPPAPNAPKEPGGQVGPGMWPMPPAPPVRVVTSRSAPLRTGAWTPPAHWGDVVASVSERYDVDARLIQAVIQVESAYAPNARSPKGAIGLMQLMPATAARYGAPSTESLLDPRVNVEVGVRYLRALLDRFGRTDLALAAYNAGEGAVMRHGYRIPPYRETQDYVQKVHRLYKGRP